MRRRDFIAGIAGSVAAWPLAARAQQPERMRRVGILLPVSEDNSEGQVRVRAFLQGLQQLGWSIGGNIAIETRWAGPQADAIRRHAVELIALAPDVILASGSSTVGPLLQATQKVPIVFPVAADPVGAGFVESLARPGRNATGFLVFEYGLGGKWLETINQMAPGVTRVAVLRDPAIASGIGLFAVIQAMAPSFRIEAVAVNVRDHEEIDRALADFARAANGGLLVTPNAVVEAD